MDLTGREPSTRPPTSQDEEAVKKNTDCVYFLASPLTCKKADKPVNGSGRMVYR
ncbi:Zinc finger CCCH domain-containing protein 32 [Acorus calamus]|uniref:Zinc finger CCCH domain-containing protein 32 n=1 Tax=Acorus calamus TaxID=4465 RepID=A0AAV9FGZ6_ACOCL|nr:Zinc finger CCCH domain-containing protein 32 [Acorus calamus]